MRTGEELLIDGVPMQQEDTWAKLSRDLHGQIVVDGKVHEVRVHVGSVDWGLKTGCHIFVDEELIGGDVDKKFVA